MLETSVVLLSLALILMARMLQVIQAQAELDRTRVSALSTQIIDLEIDLIALKVMRISR